jgi:hypothetical protein
MRTDGKAKLTAWRRPLAAIALSTSALLMGWSLWPDQSSADAALAVGQPPDVAKQGLAMGYAVNYPSKEAAQAEALKRCREFRDAPQSTRDLCKIVESFRDRCVAIALDPDSGTKGIGWAVAKKQDLAEEQAMEACIEASERKRREFCRITYTRCDKKG